MLLWDLALFHCWPLFACVRVSTSFFDGLDLSKVRPHMYFNTCVVHCRQGVATLGPAFSLHSIQLASLPPCVWSQMRQRVVSPRPKACDNGTQTNTPRDCIYIFDHTGAVSFPHSFNCRRRRPQRQLMEEHRDGCWAKGMKNKKTGTTCAAGF